MARVPSNVSLDSADRLSSFMECEKCSASFDSLYIGGVGDWRTTITCEKCWHVRRGVPFDSVIVPLVARQYDLSVDQARKIEEASQKEYEEILAKETSFGV